MKIPSPVCSGHVSDVEQKDPFSSCVNSKSQEAVVQGESLANTAVADNEIPSGDEYEKDSFCVSEDDFEEVVTHTPKVTKKKKKTKTPQPKTKKRKKPKGILQGVMKLADELVESSSFESFQLPSRKGITREKLIPIHSMVPEVNLKEFVTRVWESELKDSVVLSANEHLNTLLMSSQLGKWTQWFIRLGITRAVQGFTCLPKTSNDKYMSITDLVESMDDFDEKVPKRTRDLLKRILFGSYTGSFSTPETQPPERMFPCIVLGTAIPRGSVPKITKAAIERATYRSSSAFLASYEPVIDKFVKDHSGKLSARDIVEFIRKNTCAGPRETTESQLLEPFRYMCPKLLPDFKAHIGEGGVITPRTKACAVLDTLRYVNMMCLLDELASILRSQPKKKWTCVFRAIAMSVNEDDNVFSTYQNVINKPVGEWLVPSFVKPLCEFEQFNHQFHERLSEADIGELFRQYGDQVTSSLRIKPTRKRKSTPSGASGSKKKKKQKKEQETTERTLMDMLNKTTAEPMDVTEDTLAVLNDTSARKKKKKDKKRKKTVTISIEDEEEEEPDITLSQFDRHPSPSPDTPQPFTPNPVTPCLLDEEEEDVEPVSPVYDGPDVRTQYYASTKPTYDLKKLYEYVKKGSSDLEDPETELVAKVKFKCKKDHDNELIRAQMTQFIIHVTGASSPTATKDGNCLYIKDEEDTEFGRKLVLVKSKGADVFGPGETPPKSLLVLVNDRSLMQRCEKYVHLLGMNTDVSGEIIKYNINQ